jgi:hypothetical protein
MKRRIARIVSGKLKVATPCPELSKTPGRCDGSHSQLRLQTYRADPSR